MSSLSFHSFADLDPEAVAVVDPLGERWSRGRLAVLVNRTANALRSRVRPAEVMAIVAPNCAEYLALYMAGLDAGLRVVPVNWHLSRDELAFLLGDSAAAVVVAHERLGSKRLAEIAHGCPAARLRLVIGAAEGFTRLDSFVSSASAARIDGAERGRVMPYTSATTGLPKAVSLPVGNAGAALSKIIDWHISLGIAPEAGNVHLCASMLYHSAPLEGAYIALQMGHSVVLADRWEPRALLTLIERYRVTTSFMVPAMFVRLVKLPEKDRRRCSTSSLRFVVHGGAPCPVEVKRRMIEWWGPVVWDAYGAAEAQGTIVSAEDWLCHPGTVGKPIPGSAIKVLDDEGRELPQGHEGLVYIKPHTGDRFRYAGDPAKTAACYHGDLVTVGDVGCLDREGFLYLRDRRSDLILCSGMNVYPAEIEHVLVQHPAVADCGVVGIPHELFGQVPKAVVQPAPGASPGSRLTAELLAYLSERLAPMKLPRSIEYTRAIPRDPNGKLQRRRLSDRLQRGSGPLAEVTA